jgi:hypothetical protein
MRVRAVSLVVPAAAGLVLAAKAGVPGADDCANGGPM